MPKKGALNKAIGAGQHQTLISALFKFHQPNHILKSAKSQPTANLKKPNQEEESFFLFWFQESPFLFPCNFHIKANPQDTYLSSWA
jgi:hypothetical protein